jgi:hypothetical protein
VESGTLDQKLMTKPDPRNIILDPQHCNSDTLKNIKVSLEIIKL